MRINGHFVTLTAFAVLAGCGGGGTTSMPEPCGEPPPSAAPPAYLVYPAPGSTGIPASIDRIVVDDPSNVLTPMLLMVVASSGSVPVGAFTSAPSPLPSPNATPSGSIDQTYLAAPIGALAPATTYRVSFPYDAYPGSQKTCVAYYDEPMGSFTTQ